MHGLPGPPERFANTQDKFILYIRHGYILRFTIPTLRRGFHQVHPTTSTLFRRPGSQVHSGSQQLFRAVHSSHVLPRSRHVGLKSGCCPPRPVDRELCEERVGVAGLMVVSSGINRLMRSLPFQEPIGPTAAGNYDTRHLTGGALVKRPKTPSPCFRRPGGRLDFGVGGTWHKETPLESAEGYGTVRGNLKVMTSGRNPLQHALLSSTVLLLFSKRAVLQQAQRVTRAMYVAVLSNTTSHVSSLCRNARCCGTSNSFTSPRGGTDAFKGRLRYRQPSNCFRLVEP